MVGATGCFDTLEEARSGCSTNAVPLPTSYLRPVLPREVPSSVREAATFTRPERLANAVIRCAAMADDAPSFGDKVRYQIDRFLSWSPIARFVGLFGLSFILVFTCAVFAKLVMPPPEDPGETFDLFEALWWAMTRVADAGTMGDDKGTVVRIVATMATLSGVGVVALLIGLVSSTIGDKIEDLRKGRSPVIDEKHTLILGYNEKVFAILR